MPVRKIYSKAPIIEAVIDIHVVYPDDDRNFAAPQCAEAFKTRFPRSRPIVTVALGVKSDNDGTFSAFGQKPATIGWRLSNESENRVLQIQQQGFTYSHMHPYTSWEVFSGEVHPLWDAFVTNCRPQRITRIAMRYINLMKLPAGPLDLRDFLNLYPHLPEGIEPIDGLLMQISTVLPEVEEGAKAVITLTPAQQSLPDKSVTPFVLDLDVFCERQLEIGDSRLWTVLQRLRDAKNRLFEATLTDRMKEQIA